MIDILYILSLLLLADIVCFCVSAIAKSKDFVEIFGYTGLFILGLMFLSMVTTSILDSLGW